MNRAEVVAILEFNDEAARADLLDETRTNTYLIALLSDLIGRYDRGGILITAVRTDHPTPDGAWAHSGGYAVDLVPAEWSQENAIALLRAAAANPYVWAVGLGGSFYGLESYVTWPNDGKCTIFQDNDETHLHLDAANADGGPGER